jgi:hypothetical protein
VYSGDWLTLESLGSPCTKRKNRSLSYRVLQYVWTFVVVGEQVFIHVIQVMPNFVVSGAILQSPIGSLTELPNEQETNFHFDGISGFSYVQIEGDGRYANNLF